MQERKENEMHQVNICSNRYLQINNCGFQNRSDFFTVTRSDGWVDYQFLLISSGKCIAQHHGKEFYLVPGNFILYAPGEPQKYVFPEECQSLWLHFSGTAVPEILEECGLNSGVYHLNLDDTIIRLFSDLIEQFHLPGNRLYANALFLKLFSAVSERVKNPEQKQCPEGIVRVIGYLNEHYTQNVTLAELAAYSGYSKSRFSDLFREFIGQTPIEYQRKLRLNSAYDLLCSTELSVGKIALSCGYDDALYFSRLFHNHYGIPPTRLRQSKKK